MKNVKNIKYMAIVTFCAILDMSLHVMTSKISTIPEDANFSIVAKTIGIPAAAMLWIFISFSSVAYVFYRYEDNLPGTKSLKGLRYGGAVGLLWLWGMIEGVSLSGTTLIHETVMGLCDAVPVVLLGLLLGKFTTERNSITEKKEAFNYSTAFLSTVIFSIIFLVGRYFSYFTKIMESGYETRPYATFIWTFLMGMCIGVTYLLLGEAVKSSSKLLSAVKFGIMIFGINWAAFLIFIPMLYEGTLIDMIMRSTIDIVSVILSYYLSESFAKAIGCKMKLCRTKFQES